MAGRRSALIVASDEYADPGLKRLRAPSSDARALTAVLRDPDIGGFEVRTLLNEPAHQVNLTVEEFFADRQPDDLLLVHFSCHGVKDEDGELYFAMADTVLRRLAATAVAAEFVNRRMNRTRSRRVVLLLDCCYAGAFEHGLTARAGTRVGIESQFQGRGRAVITASTAMEYAFEGNELADTRGLAPSVFTSALVEGLQTGDADLNQDGLVALDELYDYVYDRVRAATPNQTPSKWTFAIQGELIIAHRARPVTTPALLPPELQEAIDSPLAAVRAATVQELARLLRGTHAGRALAAQLALERLAEDDSRTVAAAASALLTPQAQQLVPPRLELSATVVDFGRMAHHAGSPERRIRLRNAGGGNLNARAATQASWLRLRLEGDELVLTVDTTTAGKHEHTVTVDSDGGSASIRVQALIEPASQPAAGTVAAHPEPAAPGRAPSGIWQNSKAPAAAPAATPAGEEAAGLAAQPPWRRPWIAIVAAGVVAAVAVGGYLLLGGGKSSPPGASSSPCQTPAAATVAAAEPLSCVHPRWTAVRGEPFDAAVTGDFGFISYRSGFAVMNTASSPPKTIRRIPLRAGAQGEALTPDNKYLLVSTGSGAAVFKVSDLIRGNTHPLRLLNSPGGRYAVEVALSPGGEFAFVTLQHSGQVAVFDLSQALASQAYESTPVKVIEVGPNPIGIAASPDGNYLYVATGLGDSGCKNAGKGSLVVLDAAKAERKEPGHSIVGKMHTDSGLARVITSHDGKDVWVTTGCGNTLEAYLAAQLISDHQAAPIARIDVGQAPLGLVMVDHDRRIVLADSDRFNEGAQSDLAVIDVSKALAHKPAVLGTIKSGKVPRQFALAQNGKTLLVTNTISEEVEAVSVRQLP